MIRKLTAEECTAALAKGDFDFPGAAGALILTQSWCPQWKAVKNYLPKADEKGNLTILYVEYDLESFFEEFMKFKEESYNNREIPYIRYFKNGAFSGESNYVNLDGFLQRLGST